MAVVVGMVRVVTMMLCVEAVPNGVVDVVVSGVPAVEGEVDPIGQRSMTLRHGLTDRRRSRTRTREGPRTIRFTAFGRSGVGPGSRQSNKMTMPCPL